MLRYMLPWTCFQASPLWTCQVCISAPDSFCCKLNPYALPSFEHSVLLTLQQQLHTAREAYTTYCGQLLHCLPCELRSLVRLSHACDVLLLCECGHAELSSAVWVTAQVARMCATGTWLF